MKLIVVTGGIASGKSTVSRILSGLGASIIDADQIARELVEPGDGPRTPVMDKIVQGFGDIILLEDDKRRLDRRLLRKLVFENPPLKSRLENIMLPAIQDVIIRRMAVFKQIQGHDIVFLEAALFTDPTLIPRHPELSLLWSLINGVVVVSASEETRVKRVMKRDSVSEEDARRVIASQRCDAEYGTIQSWKITTDGSLEDTTRQAIQLWEVLHDDTSSHFR